MRDSADLLAGRTYLNVHTSQHPGGEIRGQLIAVNEVPVVVCPASATVECGTGPQTLTAQLVDPEGDAVQVGSVIIVIGEKGEKIPAVAKPSPERPRPSVGVVGELEEAPEEEAPEKSEISPKKPALPKGPVLAVPMVRRLAKDLGVDLQTLSGTGPQGRITKEDVQNAAKERERKPAEAAPAEPETVDVAQGDAECVER